MKKTIEDLYNYFDKKYSSDRALGSLMTLYGIYGRYSDVDKTDYEYNLITEIVEVFANKDTSGVTYAYTNDKREQAFQQALKEFVNNTKFDINSFDGWLEEAGCYKKSYNNIFSHSDVLEIKKDKTYAIVDLRDFLDELFDTENLNKSILEFIKYSQTMG